MHGSRHLVLDDIDQQPLTYGGLITASLALGGALAKRTRSGERVGVLLPTSRAAVVTFFALQAKARVPAMLNFSTGPAAGRAACAAAEIRLVITARRFIERAKLEPLVAALAESATVIYLEDVRREIGMVARLSALIRGRLIRPQGDAARADDPAVVLFTSGSEGTPKGVVLSHRNLLANRHQLASVIDVNPKDIVLNALPVFHSFGLTGGLLLPLLAGVKTFLYPSPLHYRTVPELAYGINATILFGTDTFLAGYARVADNYDFYSVRYVFAGAERVKPETRRVWFEKFGIRILEGYGATETAPGIAVNTPMHFKAGTVGRILPGIEHRLEQVPGIETGGRLSVSGPNVMLGYLRAENPGVLEPPPGGWYDTGDIVDIDAEGFVTIKGRVKRFAKIAGEMVPLGAVEELVAAAYPKSAHAVVALPDAKKGERLVLLTTHADIQRAALATAAREAGLPEIFLPRSIVRVPSIPVLGTGKTDYVQVMKLALDAAPAAEAAVALTNARGLGARDLFASEQSQPAPAQLVTIHPQLQARFQRPSTAGNGHGTCSGAPWRFYGDLRTRPGVCRAQPAPAAGLCGHCRPHDRARHRRDHRDLQRGQCRAAAAAALQRCGEARHGLVRLAQPQRRRLPAAAG